MKKLIFTALLGLGMVAFTGCTNSNDAEASASKCAASGKCDSAKKCSANAKCDAKKVTKKCAAGKCAAGKCGK